MSDDTRENVLSNHATVENGIIRLNISQIEYDTIAIPATPNSQLRNLIEQWRELKSDSVINKAIEKKEKRYKFECADELEGIIEGDNDE